MCGSFFLVVFLCHRKNSGQGIIHFIVIVGGVFFILGRVIGKSERGQREPLVKQLTLFLRFGFKLEVVGVKQPFFQGDTVFLRPKIPTEFVIEGTTERFIFVKRDIAEVITGNRVTGENAGGDTAFKILPLLTRHGKVPFFL
jgi:hypothetical protein